MVTTIGSRLEWMISRSVSFIEERLAKAGAVEVTDIRPTAEMESESSERRYLTISELGVHRYDASADEQDYLVIMLLTPAHEQDAFGRSGPLTVILPGSLRSSGRATSASVFVNDVLVTADAGRIDFIALLTYAVRRNDRTERIVASLQGVVDALKETRDYVSALSLSQAIIDRIEVMEATGDAELLLAGKVSGFGSDAASKGDAVYAALVDQRVQTGPGDRWWVKGSSLQIGEAVESTVPLNAGSYLLLRYGGRSTHQSVKRYIDELRRRHALKRDQLREGDRGESYDSLVEKEVEKRTKAVTDAMYRHHTMLPVVTPIALETAKDLEQIVVLSSESKTPFQLLLDAMRERLRNDYGVTVPGVRVRLTDEDWDPGQYQVMLNEIPLMDELAWVNVSERLCHANDDELSDLDVYGDSAVHPGHGTWIREDDWEVVQAAGFRLWEPVECIAAHLESILRENLAEFMGTQEIFDAFELAQSDHFERLQSAQGGVARFRSVVLALLREQLPVKGLPNLADQYLQMIELPVSEIAEEMRCLPEINAHLLRDIQEREIWRLGGSFAAQVRQGIVRSGDAALLALDPAVAEDFLSVVVDHLPLQNDGSSPPVILVENWSIRPFVRGLIESRFPKVAVIARREITGAPLFSEGNLVIGSD